MKTQKGITLIALIITIIVMLILVGVSVSVALNTGLFKTAQGVAKNTEAERINETALSDGKITIEGKGTVDLKDYANSLKPKSIIDITGEGETPTHIFYFGNEMFKISATTTWLDMFAKLPDEDESKYYSGEELYDGSDEMNIIGYKTCKDTADEEGSITNFSYEPDGVLDSYIRNPDLCVWGCPEDIWKGKVHGATKMWQNLMVQLLIVHRQILIHYGGAGSIIQARLLMNYMRKNSLKLNLKQFNNFKAKDLKFLSLFYCT